MPSMKRGASILLSCVFLVTACSQEHTLSPRAYVSYLEDSENGYKKTVETITMKYTVQLVPAEMMAIKEATRNNGIVDLQTLQTRINELQGYTFFILKMARKDKSGSVDGTSMAGSAEAEQMVIYYEQDASKDLRLNINGKSENPEVYHFENNYGLSPENTIVAGFRTSGNHNMALTFNDRYANEPLIKCSFSRESLSQLPNLKIN